MDIKLAGKQAAIMVANGFEENQMAEIQRALLKADCKVKTISTEQGLVNGWHGKGWGHYFPVDRQMGETLAADLDILIIPGGERSIAKLKQTLHTRRLITHFVDGAKPVIALAEAIELMAQADRLRGRVVAVAEKQVEMVKLVGGIPETEQSNWVDGCLITLAATEAGVDWTSWIMEQIFATLEAGADRAAA